MFKKLSILALALIPLAGCKAKQQNAEAAEEKPIVLGAQDVATVGAKDLTTGAVISGSLQPAWIVNVKAQVPGTVQSLLADRGVAVREGQPLAVVKADGIRGQAEGARAGVAAAQASLAVAAQRLESARTLQQAGAMSEIDFKAAAAGYEAAKAQLAAAQAAAAGAFEAEGHATVRAPISGTVSARFVEAGEAVNPAQPLFTVVRSDLLELSGQVPLEDAAQIRPGQAVVFALDNDARVLRGEVNRIEPVANTDTRKVGVYLRVKNPGGLLGGQFATGTIQTDVVRNALVIPQAAVRGEARAPLAYVVENGRLVAKLVQLGTVDVSSGMVEVKSGLKAGDVVLIGNDKNVTEGARVQVSK